MLNDPVVKVTCEQLHICGLHLPSVLVPVGNPAWRNHLSAVSHVLQVIMLEYKTDSPPGFRYARMVAQTGRLLQRSSERFAC